MKTIAPFILILACAWVTVVVGGCQANAGGDDADAANSMMLKLAALAAFQKNDLEEAGVLFLKSQVRFELDRIVYPPVGRGDSDPAVLKSAMSAMVGPSIIAKVKSDPKVLLSVVERLEKWKPEFPANYDPGWKYKSKIDDAETAKAIAKIRKKNLPALRKQAILLGDERYQKAVIALADIRNRMYEGTDNEIKERQTKARLLTLELFEIEWGLVPESRWHAKVGWKAEDFFKDARVIEFCHAIEDNDLEQMRELIAEGVDVNARGKDDMTPLLWSYSDHKFERFEMLLEAKADPNVVATSGFNVGRRKFHPAFRAGRVTASESFGDGSSVNMMAYQTGDVRFARAVFKHGGDVNQIDPVTGQSPIHFVMSQFPSYAETPVMVKALIEKGADLSLPNPYRGYKSPLALAISDRAFDLAIVLVESGADPNAKGKNKYSRRPTRLVLEKEGSEKEFGSAWLPKYKSLIEVMNQHGADFEAARTELDKGRAWGKQLRRQKEFLNMVRIDFSRRKNPRRPGGAFHYQWSSYNDQARTMNLSKYYSHVSSDCSIPPGSSEIAFSIKQVSKEEVKAVESSFPEFAAMGDGIVYVSPTFSGHPNWLSANGDHDVHYLRHLVAKKCKFMDRTEADFPDLPESDAGYYFLEFANDKRHHELLIPAPYLLDEKLRRESGLEGFEEVWEVLEKLKLRSMVGDVQQTAELFIEVNKKLKSQFPESLQPFYIHHLTDAKLDADGSLSCVLQFREIREFRDRIFTANCKRSSNGTLSSEVSRRAVKARE